MLQEHKNVRDLYEAVARMVKEAQEMQAQCIRSGVVFLDAGEFVAVALRHSHFLLTVTGLFFSHPEWLAELDRLLESPGCPAQKIPVVERFLFSKAEKV